jgi:hypothetical protein
MNQGVSGYGTDQEYLLVQQSLPRFHPDIVFLVYCTYNDHDDNSTNVRNNGYYKPYFVDEAGALAVRGLPVPKSLNYYRPSLPLLFESRFVQTLATAAAPRLGPAVVTVPDLSARLVAAMKQEVERAGARFYVGLVDNDRRLEPELRQMGLAYLNFRTRERGLGKFGHWSRRGHEEVARMIEEALAPELGQMLSE